MKLHELHINNFKFFPEVDPNSPLLNINGKHVLIYGENGSGKSTIYWALYTLLECSLKDDDDEIRKYFKKIGKDSLVNIHATGRNNSHIKAVLKDDLGTTKRYRASRKTRDLGIRGNTDVQESNMASDFINYRVLFQLHNLKHSKDNDLFLWFLEEVLPYVKRGTDPCLNEYKRLIKGPEKYRNIEGEDVYPVSSLRTHPNAAEKAHFGDYQAFKRRLAAWSNWLKSFLEGIMNTANSTINNDFGYNLKLKFDFTKFDFNITKNDFTPKPPEIRIKVIEYEGIQNPKIEKPHTFLNEAKWSAIGMSLRLAILDTKLSAADLKCLVIDDMLLSLDMGNRDVVLDILLNRYATDYQLIMMTHDRYFFELTKRKIPAPTQQNWMKLEMYEQEVSGKKEPLIIRSKTNLEKAINFYQQKEFAASANHMRKATEHFVKEFVPRNKQYDRSFKELDLSNLINKSRVVARANGWPSNIIADLDLMRANIFNPGSHYDVYTPVFQAELKKALDTLEAVSTRISFAI